MFVVGSIRGPLGRACWGSTSPSTCCPNTSSLDFWVLFFCNFDINKILVIVVRQGRGDKVLISILCIDSVPVVIPVPSRRGCCQSSLSRILQISGLRNYGRTASLSASQYFNIIIQGVLVCAACLLPLGHHPRPCT